jgi:hypothetical protein
MTGGHGYWPMAFTPRGAPLQPHAVDRALVVHRHRLGRSTVKLVIVSLPAGIAVLAGHDFPRSGIVACQQV